MRPTQADIQGLDRTTALSHKRRRGSERPRPQRAASPGALQARRCFGGVSAPAGQAARSAGAAGSRRRVLGTRLGGTAAAARRSRAAWPHARASPPLAARLGRLPRAATAPRHLRQRRKRTTRPPTRTDERRSAGAMAALKLTIGLAALSLGSVEGCVGMWPAVVARAASCNHNAQRLTWSNASPTQYRPRPHHLLRVRIPRPGGKSGSLACRWRGPSRRANTAVGRRACVFVERVEQSSHTPLSDARAAPAARASCCRRLRRTALRRRWALSTHARRFRSMMRPWWTPPTATPFCSCAP